MSLPIINQGQKYKLINTISTHYGTLHEGEVVRLDSVGYPERDCRVVDSLGRAWFVNFDDMKIDGGEIPLSSPKPPIIKEKLKKKAVEKSAPRNPKPKKTPPRKTALQSPITRKPEQKRQVSKQALPKKSVARGNVRKKR